MIVLMLVLVMVMGDLVGKEGDVCEEVKKSVDCIVLRAGRRHVPDKIFLLKLFISVMLKMVSVVRIARHYHCC